MLNKAITILTIALLLTLQAGEAYRAEEAPCGMDMAEMMHMQHDMGMDAEDSMPCECCDNHCCCDNALTSPAMIASADAANSVNLSLTPLPDIVTFAHAGYLTQNQRPPNFLFAS